MRAINIRYVAMAASVAAIATAGQALAADVVYQEPPAPSAPIISTPVSTWAGPYGGINFGYGFGNTDTSLAAPDNRIDTRGWMASGFVGWQGQSNSLVYGAEAELGYNFMHDRNANFGSQGRWDGSLRARLGYAVSDATLLYVTAGGALAGHSFHDAAGADRETHFGWTAGAGIDQKLTDNVFGRLEYRYTDLSTKTYNTPGLGATSVDPDNHRITVGVGMKF